MTEKVPTLSYPDDLPVIFVNELVTSGFLNGVVNLMFAAARFTLDGNGEVDPDLIAVCNMRMDLYAAQRLHERLGRIIEQTTKPAGAREH